MGLFGDLPAPAKRPADQLAEDAQRSKAAKLDAPGSGAPPEPSAADLDDLDEGPQAEEEGPGGEGTAQGAIDEDDVPPPPPPPLPPGAAAPPAPTTAAAAGGDDQVSAALRKIASHIGHPKKFAKASALLRELLAQGAVRQPHGSLLFSALKAAMSDPGRAADPLLAREYSKLFTGASKVAEVFTLREKNQLDVYGTWAVMRNQLTTDDSFQFNKVVGRLKEMVGELPEATEDDEQLMAAAAVAARAGAPDPVLQAYDQRQQEAAAVVAAAGGGKAAGAGTSVAAVGAGEDVEADPFGLDAFMEQQEAAAAAEAAARERQRAAAAVRSATWSSREVVCQRRAALLDCLDTAKACYRHMWARTSVDLLIEHYHANKHRFLPSQHQQIDDLMGFVRDQRRVRKLGPSAKEVNRDSTSFERARAEWSRAAVSHRGKLGAGGDHKTEQWLGVALPLLGG